MSKQIIIVRKDLHMRKGKLAAQVAHASMAFLTRQLQTEKDGGMIPAIALGYVPHAIRLSHVEQDWIDDHFTKIVVGVNSEEELHEIGNQAILAGLIVHRVLDCGRTEFHGRETFTALAIGPDEDEKINPITEHLQLL